MLNDSPNLLFPVMRRVRQPNDWYCGPAVLEMLVSLFGVNVPQEEYVRAAGAMDTIKTHGMILSELAKAVEVLLPDYAFWFKRESSMGELSSLVNKCGYPVGVEWQGIFDDDEDDEDSEDENGDDDAGHYSVITGLNTNDNWIMLADPYHNKGVDRQLSILEFERRWWDINEYRDPMTGRWHQIDDYHALFVVLPKGDATPDLFGMTTIDL